MKFRQTGILIFAVMVVFATAQDAAAASSKSVPTIDLQTRCRRSEVVMADMIGDKTLRGKGFDMCMRSEQEARNALEAAWPDVPPSFKSFCIAPTAYSPSYIEWIACLEMLIDLRKLRATAKP